MSIIRPTSSTTEGFRFTTDDVVVVAADVVISLDDGVPMSGSGDNVTLRNCGTLSAGPEGVSFITATDLDFVNYGQIDGFVGIDMTMMGGLFQNRGDVVGARDGIRLSNSTDAGILNTGLISGDSIGLVVNSLAEGTIIRNTGRIEGTGVDGVGFVTSNNTAGTVVVNTGEISGGSLGVILGGEGAVLRNSGLIENGVDLQMGDMAVTNNGVISGATAIRALGFDGDKDIVNRGVIDGRISLRGDNEDSLNNTGTVNGDVTLWEGNDRVANKGNITGIVDLGAGDDVFNGRDGGAVRVKGDAGSDRIFGGAFDDVLGGGTDDDVISAGGGDDILAGGFGRDIMTGGDGADQFFFETIADSIETDRDLIRDFAQGEDTLVFWQIFYEGGPVDITFVGDTDFSGSGGIELRYGARGSQRTEVALDVDGDGTAELIFDLAGRHDLTLDDFVLDKNGELKE